MQKYIFALKIFTKWLNMSLPLEARVENIANVVETL